MFTPLACVVTGLVAAEGSFMLDPALFWKSPIKSLVVGAGRPLASAPVVVTGFTELPIGPFAPALAATVLFLLIPPSSDLTGAGAALRSTPSVNPFDPRQ